MAKKIRELKAMLHKAGFVLVPGGGKGSHSKWTHPGLAGSVILSGQNGDDAKPYQEKDVRNAIRAVQKDRNP